MGHVRPFKLPTPGEMNVVLLECINTVLVDLVIRERTQLAVLAATRKCARVRACSASSAGAYKYAQVAQVGADIVNMSDKSLYIYT